MTWLTSKAMSHVVTVSIKLKAIVPAHDSSPTNPVEGKPVCITHYGLVWLYGVDIISQ